MAARAFPNYIPTARSYSPGTYPQAEFKAINGATTTLRYGNRRYDSTLNLTFENIHDDRAAVILGLYETTMVGNHWVVFNSNNGTAGASASLAAYLAESGGSGLRWRFAEPPSVRSVKPGLSTVEVTMVGQLDPS